MKPMTERLFSDAGIKPGMRVLDLGSGAGDVCMLLADMVGRSGEVIGLDVDGDAVAHATERARAAGYPNIRFVHSDIEHYTADGPLDAVVGRLVLMYQKDPATALGKVGGFLRPGGVAAFIEPLFQIPPGPESTMKTVVTCLVETLQKSGAHADLGWRLHRVFQGAGLPLPKMRFEALMDPQPDSPLYQYVADTVAHLLPKAIELGVPVANQIDTTVIAERMRAEMNAVGFPMMSTPVVCAWANKER
jgi:ubiquinone/menaquinone biosynthesis C-methylase UbiE